MTGGRASKRKGKRREREFAVLIGGSSMPLSRAAGGEYSRDVRACGLVWEVKARANGFRQLYQWLEGKDALAVRADRLPWLVVFPLDMLLTLLV